MGKFSVRYWIYGLPFDGLKMPILDTKLKQTKSQEKKAFSCGHVVTRYIIKPGQKPHVSAYEN